MIVLLMGVSGSGKTTVGELLASNLGWNFEDADDFHPEANVTKMSQGIPLTDEDRRRAKEIREYPWFAKKEWQKEIQHMERLGVKLELEALSSKGISYSTKVFLPRKLKERDWLD